MSSKETDLLVQSLQAAYSTTNDGFIVHSIHAFFTETGSQNSVRFNVERTRDGRNFLIRFVKAEENERLCLLSEFSFQRKESVKDRYSMNPKFPKDLPDPETLKAQLKATTEMSLIEIRPFSTLPTSKLHFWVKSKNQIDPDDIKERQAFLVKLSGYNLFNEHNDEPINDYFTWFHQYFFDPNDWLFFEMDEIDFSLSLTALFLLAFSSNSLAHLHKRHGDSTIRWPKVII
ncbi:unnamed protein product, partial [Mesorhabditis belari]|uniref:Acyl-CoA thioesterase-like N-terminal HotDog domain-containing protein n=1 Tax=Mesorhabditis belari TaxID=2138241 RepID=A0AAF3EDD9_9BILA